MFAIPGICALIVFILARPQEFILLLQRVPFLHLFTALAVLGWIIDIRLRRLQPQPAPTLPWIIALILWAILGTAIVAPEHLIERILEFAILFALYGTIAHGVQRFRTFRIVSAVLVVTCLAISALCFHQGLSDLQCVGGEESEGQISGEPDGRSCERDDQCRGPDAEPGKEYRCEHVGLFGTYSVEQRVRYTGELHDPNEVCLTIISGALSMLVAFARRNRRPLTTLVCGAGIALVVLTIFETQSRGGLIGIMLIPGVYLFRRYGPLAVIIVGLLAVPLMLLAGRSGEAADMSTQLRYEAWATGLALWKASPIFGVGARLFTNHFFMTAHNSFVLTLTELGFPGMVLFVSVIYLSFKTLIVGMRGLSDVPAARVAQDWGMALFGSMCVIVFQINTLSFAYHSVLWIFFGLVGAWYSAVKHHWPEFEVRLTWRDLGIIVAASLIYVLMILPVFLKAKGEM